MEAHRRAAALADEERKRAAEEASRKRSEQAETAASDKAPVFNFPNAKFDITQKFAEGFDPDRVAAAMMSDIAAAGERRIQSLFGSPFAVR